jgi:hypothetical protein
MFWQTAWQGQLQHMALKYCCKHRLTLLLLLLLLLQVRPAVN